jgi:ribosomal protein L40E
MAEEAAVGEQVCLRCDWTGETDGETCPRCGAALYRIPESTKPREVMAPNPQPEGSGDRMSSSPIKETQDDESVPPALPVAASRRWWVIAGGAFAVTAVWAVAMGGPFARTDAPIASGPPSAVATTPVNEPPTVNPADPAAAAEVARGFLDAYAAFDAKKAMTYVADDADLRNLIDLSHQIPANAEGLSLRLSLLQAMGVELTVTSCEAAPFGSDTSVVCESVFHALGSDQIGRGPFSNSSFVFTVRDGAIVRAGSGSNPLDKFDRQMWEPFAEWVSSTYPNDAAIMYLDGTRYFARFSVPRFSLESIRLWERHTREYAEE